MDSHRDIFCGVNPLFDLFMVRLKSNYMTRIRSNGTLFSVLVAGFLLAACATPERRIRSNPERFDSFPLDAQGSIRAGKIALGFTPEMVEMAKGHPSRRYSRYTSDGTLEIWSYVRTYPYTTSQPVYVGGRRGGTEWINVTATQEVEELKVEFSEGKAVVIEERKE